MRAPEEAAVDGRRGRLTEEHLRQLPTVAPRRLSTTWAWVLGLGWAGALVGGMLLEPPPADPEAVAAPAVDLIVGLAVPVALIGTFLTVGRRAPQGPAWACALGAMVLGLSLACPASGHHAVGAWWYGQLGLVGAMLGVSALAWRRTRVG